MNTTRRLTSIFLLLAASLATAGEKHIGTAETRTDACALAEKTAEQAARNTGLNGTCYDRCDFSKCEKVDDPDDPYWQCYTHSANTSGACDNDAAKIRVKKQ